MKKKLTVNRLASSSIKARKKQYAAMIFSIVIAMIFSSGVLFFASSILSSIQENNRRDYGTQDGICVNADDDIVNKATEQNCFKDYGYAHVIGRATSDTAKNNSSASIAWLDNKAMKLSYITFVDGGYPTKDNEIALEQNALFKLGFADAKVGDKITLSVFPQAGSDILSEATEKTYTLSGIATNKLSNFTGRFSIQSGNIPSAFVAEGTNTEVGGRESLTAYYTLTSQDAYTRLYEIFDTENSGREWLPLSSNILGSQVDFSNSSPMFLGAGLAVVLMLASCMGIINAMSSNLKDRRRQIGMLRTVGATRRQIINIFGREALIIAGISAPVSVAVSYFAAKWIISFIDKNLVFKPQLWVLALCAAVSILCVMAAAAVPLIAASRISPVQSIRGIDNTRKMKTKHIKTQKEFVTQKLLAKRNLTFLHGRQTVVSIILALTVIISCAGFSFVTFIKDDSSYSFGYDYFLSSDFNHYSDYWNADEWNKGYSENDLAEIQALPYTQSAGASKMIACSIITGEYNDYEKTFAYGGGKVFKYIEDKENINTDNLDEIFNKNYSDQYINTKQLLNGKDFLPGRINSLMPSAFDKMSESVADGKIDVDKLNSGEEIILVAPKNIYFSKYTGKKWDYSFEFTTQYDKTHRENLMLLKQAECPYKAGDKLDIAILSGDKFTGDNIKPDHQHIENKTVTVGAVIHDLEHDNFQEMHYASGIFMITSTAGMDYFLPGQTYDNIKISLNTDCDDTIDKEMTDSLQAITQSVDNGSFTSTYSVRKNDTNMYNAVLMGIIAVAILLLSICAGIVNNALTARIREGKREIGTLRAVGASQKEITASYIRQLVSMLFRGYIAGFALSGIIYGIVMAVLKIRNTPIDLKLTLWPALLACLITISVCSINLYFKIRKETKNSIIDNIREL